MVSPSKSIRSEIKRNAKLTKKARKSSLYLQSVKSEARLAAQHAAQRAAGIHITCEDDGSVGSGKSTERAVKRGSSRALIDSFEETKQADQRALSDNFSFGLATISEEETTTSQTSRRKKYTKKGRRDIKVRKRVVSFGSEDIAFRMASANDAWMCGCCGKVFSTYKSAETHEEKCVQEYAAKLGLIKPPSPSKEPKPSSAADTPGRSASLLDFVDAHSMESWEKDSDDEAEDNRKSVEFAPTVEQTVSPQHTPDHNLAPTATTQSILRHSDPPSISRSPSNPSTVMTGLRRPSLLPMPGSQDLGEFDGDDQLLPSATRKYMMLSDEALVNVVLRAVPMLLSPSEMKAERALKLLAADKAYYDAMSERAEYRKKYRLTRAEGSGVFSKVQNKFVDAYQLIKEGDGADVMGGDQYTVKKKGGGGAEREISHTGGTVYVNVIVKNSVRVVDNELERLAQQRWEDLRESTIVKDEKKAQFERFRKFAHAHAVKLAGLALQSDFTPRRIAVQLSNDLYRLIVPRLKRRGIAIETEIEYRVGAYFVLAANVKHVEWVKFLMYSRKDKELRQKKWQEEQVRRDKLREGTTGEGVNDDEKLSKFTQIKHSVHRIWQMTTFEVIANSLALSSYLPYVISVPFWWLMYHLFFKATMNIFIMSTAADRIFAYVEEKGMEMDISVEQARYQGAFMLAALRELREDSRELKKKREETESADKGAVLGPLLGPAIKSDKGPATPPPGFTPPENLEFVGLETDLPVGFKRLRWALLSSDSKFCTEAVFAAEAKYEDITCGAWSVHDKEIGSPMPPKDTKLDDFIGAEKEVSYLMPKSAFVKANMAYETHIITEYNDYCFAIKKKTRTPDVPYGSTFITWTQVVVTDTGNDSCRMVCSVEAEFPNGPPMVGGQIKSGMRSGTAQFFVLMGETICKYADEYP